MTAWSEWVTETGNYVLALREKGKVTYPNISKRANEPFDVTLGPAEDGHTVALYSRCATAAGTGCDAFKYDLRSKKETRIEQISSTTKDEAWPAQWRHNYAFVRHQYGAGKNDVVGPLRQGLHASDQARAAHQDRLADARHVRSRDRRRRSARRRSCRPSPTTAVPTRR